MTSSLVGSGDVYKRQPMGFLPELVPSYIYVGYTPFPVPRTDGHLDLTWTVSYTHLTLPTICSV
eukprot:804160-Prorocentrum_lima.AAC.1